MAALKSLIGVYNASGTLLGELSYFVRARFGLAHCALCTITHGLVSEKAEFAECKRQLKVPFTTVHLNDAPESVLRLIELTGAPVVVGDCDRGLVVLMTPNDLEACDGNVDDMLKRLRARCVEERIGWPE